MRANPQQETPQPPLYYRNLSTKARGNITMFYETKQKLANNWRPLLRGLIENLIIGIIGAALIALVTVDFFNLGG